MVTIHPNLKPWHQSVPSNLQHHSHTKLLIPSRFSCNASSSESSQSSPAGRIKRFVLPQEGRTKLNTYPDRDFYAYPRFVTHVDNGFISTLTNLYREKLRPDSEVLDLMSSWISHLPKEVGFKKVVGHGLNAQELSKNPRLDYFFVKDLNQDQKLELESSSFDAVPCTVSVQYLQQPEKVSAGGVPDSKARTGVHSELQQPIVLRESNWGMERWECIQPDTVSSAILPICGRVYKS